MHNGVWWCPLHFMQLFWLLQLLVQCPSPVQLKQSFLDRMIFLLSGACYWFVTFTSTIDQFSCFRVLMCLHEMLSSMLLFECSALSFKSLNRVSFSPFTYFFNQLIESAVFLVIICSHEVSSNTTKLVVHALLYSRTIRLFLSTYPL